VSVPSRAQDVQKLKEKYGKGGQKPAAAPPLGPDLEAPAASGPRTVAEIEEILVKSRGCVKNPEETAELAPALKGKYSLVTCENDDPRVPPKDRMRKTLIAADNEAVPPGGTLGYGHVPEMDLIRARLVDHYLVLAFERQVQYLDLLKLDENSSGLKTFKVAGVVVGEQYSRFTDAKALKHALTVQGGLKADSELASKIEGLTKKAVGDRPHMLNAAKSLGAWIIVAVSNGEVFHVWPEKKP